MTSTLLDVPAHHAFEYQEILAASEIDHTMKKLPGSTLSSPVTFEITTTSEKAELAEKLLSELDTYSAVTFVTSRKIEETITRAAAFGLEVISNKVAFRILGKPHLHRLEIKGLEVNLNRFYSKKEIPPVSLRSATPIVITASRGGSGKGTVPHIHAPASTISAAPSEGQHQI